MLQTNSDPLDAIVGFFLIFPANAFAQQAGRLRDAAEVETRIIVTGSNISKQPKRRAQIRWEHIGPPDIEKLGDFAMHGLQNFSTAGGRWGGNLNIGKWRGQGTVQINLRGLLPKRTLILIDGNVSPLVVRRRGRAKARDINLVPSR